MNFLKQTLQEFSEDRCTQMAAALAFYTVLSLVPLLVVIVTVASLIMGPEAQRSFSRQASHLIGTKGAEELQELLSRGQERQPFAPLPPSRSTDEGTSPPPVKDTPAATSGPATSEPAVVTLLTNLISVLVLIFSATGVMAQLQTSLNHVWDVAPDPDQSQIAGFLKKRLLSLAMILAIAFLMLVSMLLTTVLSAFGAWFSTTLGVGSITQFAISEGTTFVIVSILFAAMFKVLPDVYVPWKVTWRGALITALLFTFGKFLIGVYLGHKDMSSSYGQAGSLILILLWTYYSALIFFLGAEMTQVWARRQGSPIDPEKGAALVSPDRPSKKPAASGPQPAPRRESIGS
jgi:membrane protein